MVYFIHNARPLKKASLENAANDDVSPPNWAMFVDKEKVLRARDETARMPFRMKRVFLFDTAVLLNIFFQDLLLIAGTVLVLVKRTGYESEDFHFLLKVLAIVAYLLLKVTQWFLLFRQRKVCNVIKGFFSSLLFAIYILGCTPIPLMAMKNTPPPYMLIIMLIGVLAVLVTPVQLRIKWKVMRAEEKEGQLLT